MILQRTDPGSSRLARVTRKIIYITGLVSLSLIVIVIILLSGPNSLFGKRFIGQTLLKYKNNLVGKHFAVDDASSLEDYIKNTLIGLTSTNNFPQIELKIKQKSVLSLHGDLENGSTNYVPATIDTTDSAGVKVSLKAKIRPKGDRQIHRENIRDMSYRVNLKDDKLFAGAEEFSLQHPVVRNFTWEPLIAEIARREGILSLDTFPVNFSVNGISRGIYFFEEVPGKFTVERQQRKNGPIFGLDEKAAIIFPDVAYEVYEERKWLANDEQTYLLALNKLNKIKAIDISSADYNEAVVEEIFDLRIWAKYFALIDRFGAYHASVPKSVKLYYSPTTGKFEPLLFDAHIGAGHFNQFSFANMIDYSSDRKGNCGWICRQHQWFRLFFNPQNSKFLDHYFKATDHYLSDVFGAKIKDIYTGKFLPIDQELYASFYLSDKIFYRGLTYYYFDYDWLDKRRAEVLAARRNAAARSGSWVVAGSDSTQSDRETTAPSELTSNTATITKLRSFSFSGSNLNFSEPTVLILRGNTILHGTSASNPLKISGPVMIVQLGGKIDMRNVIFEQLRHHDVHGRNWSGGVNLIESTATFDNVSFVGINAEDSLNSVNTRLESNDIRIVGSTSDALDIDFGSFSIGSLVCEDIGNDCLDVSGATGEVNEIHAQGVADKLVSAGESSAIQIGNVTGKNIGIGVVSKDSSKLHVKTLSLSNTGLEGATFNKKEFFGPANLILEQINPSSSNAKILLGEGNTLSINSKISIEELPSSEIEKLMYGNIYGKATVK